MNGLILEYEKDDFSKITLAYAMTVHKSQGSEADCVVTCLCPFHKEMAVRNIPYTAFSRGKKELLFVGDVNTLKKAIETVRANRRITTLSEEIKYYGGDFVAA